MQLKKDSFWCIFANINLQKCVKIPSEIQSTKCHKFKWSILVTVNVIPVLHSFICESFDLTIQLLIHLWARVLGSMQGTPMEVSVALSMLLAESVPRDSPLHGRILTFETRPETSNIIVDRGRYLAKIEGWGYCVHLI